MRRRAFILNLFKPSSVRVNCQEPTSLITAIAKLERARCSTRARACHSPRLFSLPAPLLLSSYRRFLTTDFHVQARAKIGALSVERKRCRSKVSRAPIRAESRTVTYRARINPRRPCNLSSSARAASFFRIHSFSPPLFPLLAGSLSRIDVTHPRCADAEHIGDRNKARKRDVPRMGAARSKRQLMVRRWKNVIVSRRACATRDNSYNKLYLRDKADW